MKDYTEAIEMEYNKKCEEHPEYTVAQKECLMYSLLAGKACEVSPERIDQKGAYNKFVLGNPTFVGFSENALRPLIREQDPEIQQKVIALVAKGGERKEELYGTERKMKAAIARYKDVEPEKPQPKYQNKADFMEECTAFWVKARRYWEEEVIEEVLDKARINTR